MEKQDGDWFCKKCDFRSRAKTRMWEHVEALHTNCSGYECPACHKICPNYAAFKNHKSRYHRNPTLLTTK